MVLAVVAPIYWLIGKLVFARSTLVQYWDDSGAQIDPPLAVGGPSIWPGGWEIGIKMLWAVSGLVVLALVLLTRRWWSWSLLPIAITIAVSFLILSAAVAACGGP